MTEKENFAEKLEEFVTELKEHISTDDGQWTVKGFIDVFKNVYTISCNFSLVAGNNIMNRVKIAHELSQATLTQNQR